MAAGDLYLARMQMSFLGQALENRFYISHINGTGTASTLGGTLDQIYAPSMKAVQSVNVSYQQNVVVNLDDTTDFATTPVAGAGVRIGDSAPPFQSWGFTLFSTDTRFRSGGKRLGGLSESDVDDGLATGTVVASLTNLALVWFNTFQNVGLTNTYQQVLHTDGNLKTFGLPLTIALRSISYRRVTTQSSRKFST